MSHQTRSQSSLFRHPFNRRQVLTGGAAAAVGLAAARTGGLAQSDVTGDFKLLSWEDEGEMRKWRTVIDRFFAENYPKMKVEYEWGVPFGDYWTKQQTSIAGGAPPDLCWMHNSRNASFAALELVQPLDDFLAANTPDGWPDQFYAAQVEAFRYNGKQYAIPYDWASSGFYVNQNLYGQAGVELPTEETTFDDLLDAGLKIKTAGEDPDRTWGFWIPTWHSGSYWIVRGFGGETVAGNPPKSHFDDPNTLAAYQWLYDALWTHKVMPTTAALESAGLSPEFAFIGGQVGVSWGLNDAAFRMEEAIAGKFDWTVAPTSKGAAGRFQFVGGSGFSIPAGSAHADIAYETIKYTITDPSNLPEIGTMGSMFVSRSDFWQYGLPPEDSGLDPAAFQHVFYDLGKRDQIVPLYHPKYNEWETSIYNRHMDRLWVGEESDVAKVLEQVHTDTEALLADLQ